MGRGKNLSHPSVGTLTYIFTAISLMPNKCRCIKKNSFQSALVEMLKIRTIMLKIDDTKSNKTDTGFLFDDVHNNTF